MPSSPLRRPPRGDFLAESTAAAYEAYTNAATVYQDTSRHLVEVGEVAPGHSVLDVACGTGFSAIEAARVAGPSGNVVGVDVSYAMLRRAVTSSSVPAWVCTRAEFVDRVLRRRFDRILCNCAIWQFDLPAACAAFARSLSDGGKFTVSVASRTSPETAKARAHQAERVWRGTIENFGFAVVEITHRRYEETGAQRALWAGVVGVSADELAATLPPVDEAELFVTATYVVAELRQRARESS